MRRTTCQSQSQDPVESFLLTIYRVWSQISSSLGTLRSVFADNEVVAGALKKFILQLATPAAENLGWEFSGNEDYLTGQLRNLLIGMVGSAGHEG